MAKWMKIGLTSMFFWNFLCREEINDFEKWNVFKKNWKYFRKVKNHNNFCGIRSRVRKSVWNCFVTFLKALKREIVLLNFNHKNCFDLRLFVKWLNFSLKRFILKVIEFVFENQMYENLSSTFLSFVAIFFTQHFVKNSSKFNCP